MKIIETQHIKYVKRIIRSLFPNVSSLLIYPFIGVLSTLPLKFNSTDKIFWILLIISTPLPIYLIIVKPYIESKIYITKIELNENKKEIKIDFLKFKLKKQITIRVQDIKYNVFNAVRISLADRISFYYGEKKLLTQYSNSSWNITKINDVAKSLEKLGIKKPYGYNK